MPASSKHQQKVLVAVTGLSPQVVTETLYAMLKRNEPMPDRIELITTKRGKTQAWLGLGFGNKDRPGQLSQFCQDYGCAPIAFSQENIHVIRSADGRQADDISTEADHVAMADFILSHIKRLTDDQNTVIHASLAGGRKTMTFFMGYALSLYGRVCDTLSHVLVTDGFESLRDFYYPTPYDHTLPGRNNNELLNAKDARVTLTDIPFVRLRDEIPQSLIAGQASYAQVIERLNLSSRPLFLVIDLPRCQLICSDIDIPMAPINLAFYLWFVERHLQNMPPLEVPPKGTKDKIYASEFLRQYRKVVDAFKADDAAMTGLKDGMSHDYFSERKSRVMRDLKHYLGEELAKRYGIQVLDRRGRYQRFGLAIPRDKLSVNDH